MYTGFIGAGIGNRKKALPVLGKPLEDLIT